MTCARSSTDETESALMNFRASLMTEYTELQSTTEYVNAS